MSNKEVAIVRVLMNEDGTLHGYSVWRDPNVDLDEVLSVTKAVLSDE